MKLSRNLPACADRTCFVVCGGRQHTRARSRNNGVLNGSMFTAGYVGQGFDFNNETRVTVVDNPADFNKQKFTVEAWITAQSFTCPTECAVFIVSKSGSNGTFGFELGLTRESGFLRFSLNGAAGGADVIDDVSLNDGNFHHVAAVYDGATMKIFLDGVLANQKLETATINYEANSPFVIGSRQTLNSTRTYPELIDEVGYYNRALSASEIAAIHAAGTAGKCKPTATVAPANGVGWWSGDGNANDISGGGNNGTPENGAGFVAGRAGQGFLLDGIDDQVVIGNVPSLELQTGDFTIEAWANIAQSKFNVIAGKDGCGDPNIYSLLVDQSNAPGFSVVNSAGDSFIVSASAVSLNEWHHIAGVKEGTNIKIYVDGVLQNTLAISGTFGANNKIFAIGDRINSNPTGCGNTNFSGRIDEVSLYNRALTAAETQSIFNAEIAGKLKTAATPTGLADFGFENSDSGFEKNEMQIEKQTPQSPQVVNVIVGDATVSYPSVTTAGTTQQIPLDPALFPALPMGTHTGLIYDIATDAVFTGNPTVCFNLPSFDPKQFADLLVMHFEAGAWVDVTDSNNSTFPMLCTNPVSSFSPFAIVSVPVLSASVSVGGQVFDSEGRAIYRAEVVMTDGQGGTRTALTNSFGYYTIEGIPAGAIYFFNVRAKEHQFQMQAVTVNDNISNLDFTASP